MNRGIKFRAWDGNEMWYQGQDKTTLVFWGQPDKIPFGIYNDADGSRLMTGDSKAVFNNPATLMQFTGIKDKNGVDIYEGDVISGWKKGSNSDRSYTGVIEWQSQQAGWVVRCGKFILEILSLAMSGDGEETRLDSFEVIGNLYSNPELIKQ